MSKEEKKKEKKKLRILYNSDVTWKERKSFPLINRAIKWMQITKLILRVNKNISYREPCCCLLEVAGFQTVIKSSRVSGELAYIHNFSKTSVEEN